MEEKKKRGRPKGWNKPVTVPTPQENLDAIGELPTNQPDIQQQIVEVVKEIFVEKIIEIPKKELQGFELYKKLKDKGYFQGGALGAYMEDPNGTERVYVPHFQEVIAIFIGDPELMDKMRDAVVRAYIELQ